MTTEDVTPQALQDSDVPPAEAGVSLNWTMLDRNGANVQVTMRATFAASWPGLMKHRAAFMEKALENGWTIPGKAQAQPSGLPPAPVAPQAAPAPEAATPPPGGKQVQEIVATRIEVTPKPDGKAELKFYGAGDKYPRIYSTKPAATWESILGWAASNFGQALTIQQHPDGRALRLTIGYTLSEKLNSQGKPYKDIEYIR